MDGDSRGYERFLLAWSHDRNPSFLTLAFLAIRRLMHLQRIKQLWGMREGQIYIITSSHAGPGPFSCAVAEPEVQAVAWLARVSFFMFRRTKVRFATCSNPPPDWREANLILLGGPDYNTVTKEVLAARPCGDAQCLQFDRTGDTVITPTGERFGPDTAPSEDKDFEVVMKFRQPLAASGARTCLLLAGGRAKGTQAAALIVTNHVFAERILSTFGERPFELILNGVFDYGIPTEARVVYSHEPLLTDAANARRRLKLASLTCCGVAAVLSLTFAISGSKWLLPASLGTLASLAMWHLVYLFEQDLMKNRQ